MNSPIAVVDIRLFVIRLINLRRGDELQVVTICPLVLRTSLGYFRDGPVKVVIALFWVKLGIDSVHNQLEIIVNELINTTSPLTSSLSCTNISEAAELTLVTLLVKEGSVEDGG